MTVKFPCIGPYFSYSVLYKLLASILSAVCSVIQQSYYHILATVFCATKQPPIQL